MWIFDSGILKWLIIVAGVVISIRRKIQQNNQQTTEDQDDKPVFGGDLTPRERDIIESVPRKSKDFIRKSLESLEQQSKPRRVEPLTKKVAPLVERENSKEEVSVSLVENSKEENEPKDIKKIKFDLRQAVIQSVILERKFEE